MILFIFKNDTNDIICTFPNNEFPFDFIDDENINGYYEKTEKTTAGKTTLINMNKDKLTEYNKVYKYLAPTNLAALLINCTTIQKKHIS